ncbi:FHA domain-containing protein [Dactylosporangium sp. AC04546]|uniref:FHA domain-containing protein n=1 Tax=Dactylosporangium sp. AC04546 TaxID=2862460 RepID=UPI001EDF5531|nr:FHA domain-containing protein [Dactylosporangium sp. AC04546]WVK86251.1 FHA domain-containing protein [Dactylosporangium sp. AC04546]
MTGYVPGDWLAFAGKSVWALANVAPGDPETEECWKLVQAGATAAEIAGVLSGGSFGTASFVVVRADMYGARALVRGDAHAEVLDIDGYTVSVRAADGAGRDVFRPVATIRLAGPYEPKPAPAELPVDRGVVLASSLLVRLNEEAEPSPEDPAAAPAPATPAIPRQPTAEAPLVPAGASDSSGPSVFRAGVVTASGGANAPLTTDLRGAAEAADPLVAPPVPAAAPAKRRSRSTISAVRCVVGHLNPPGSVLCRVCRVPVPPQSAVEVPLPLPGHLRLPSGDTVPLDRAIILGRAPGLPDPDEPILRRHVTVTSANNGISRRHVEIRVDGWEVVAVDLGSRNGTVIQQPGERPVPLPAGGSQTLRPGAAVVLTDEVSVRYEVTG